MTDGPVQMRNGDSNNAGSFSSDYVDGSHRWPDGMYELVSLDEAAPPRRGLPVPLRELYLLREAIFQDHVNYQQGLMVFLATDPSVPAALQARVNRFGLDPREFPESGHWPHALYVREGRRMVADYVMTQADCESMREAGCLSASHVAYGSIRMEPVFMILGQSAGVAAALAIDLDTPVQDVPYPQLKAKLLVCGKIL